MPSHLLINGNEKADLLAKESLQHSPNEDEYTYQHSDFKNIIKKYTHMTWENTWKEETQNKLNKVQSNIKPKLSTSNLSSCEYRKLIRLKIGPCNFTHKYI